MTIFTLDELANYLHTLKDSLIQRNLESYLLALYKNLTDNKAYYLASVPTLSLMATILENNINAESATFDEAWLNITEPPDTNRFDHHLSPPQGFAYTLAVIQFQIAELHKMRGKQLNDEQRYYGINSATGHRWYNFDPYSNLSCGLACMIDNDEDISQLDWSFIGNLLEDGRIYE